MGKRVDYVAEWANKATFLPGQSRRMVYTHPVPTDCFAIDIPVRAVPWGGRRRVLQRC